MLSQSTVVRILLRDRVQILSYIDSFLADPASAEDCYQDVCAAAVAKEIDFEDENHVFRQPPFPRPPVSAEATTGRPVRPIGSFRGLPQKAN